MRIAFLCLVGNNCCVVRAIEQSGILISSIGLLHTSFDFIRIVMPSSELNTPIFLLDCTRNRLLLFVAVSLLKPNELRHFILSMDYCTRPSRDYRGGGKSAATNSYKRFS